MNSGTRGPARLVARRLERRRRAARQAKCACAMISQQDRAHLRPCDQAPCEFFNVNAASRARTHRRRGSSPSHRIHDRREATNASTSCASCRREIRMSTNRAMPPCSLLVEHGITVLRRTTWRRRPAAPQNSSAVSLTISGANRAHRAPSSLESAEISGCAGSLAAQLDRELHHDSF